MNQYDYGFKREDLGPGLITAGLSMLSNNDGRMSVPQLIGQGGLDAIAGLQFRKQMEAQQARQQMLDERAQAQHDMQMQKGQFELDEANRRADLMKRWQAGDQSAYKMLFPEQWAADQRQAQAHRNALALEALKQKKDVGKYVDGVGMVSPSGVVTPLTDASGAPYQTPKQRKEQLEADKQAKSLENQRKLAIQSANTLLASIDNALDIISGAGGMFNTGLPGKIQSFIPWTPAANLESELDTIGSGAMLHALGQLKAASPTGASGLGALSEKEGQALRDSLGSLSTSQSPAQLRRNLENIKNLYTGMLLDWGYTQEQVAEIFKRQQKKQEQWEAPPLPDGFVED